MLIPLGGLLLGAILGALGAKRRGGKGADMAQWGTVMALILGVVGLAVMIALDRMLR